MAEGLRAITDPHQTIMTGDPTRPRRVNTNPFVLSDGTGNNSGQTLPQADMYLTPAVEPGFTPDIVGRRILSQGDFVD